MDDLMLQDLAIKASVALAQQGLLLATAESCTGGWLGQTITSIAGSSSWYDRGFITYATASKHEMLGVSTSTLEQYGAVSEQTASEMAAGVITHSHAQVAVSITGIAGPDGGTAGKTGWHGLFRLDNERRAGLRRNALFHRQPRRDKASIRGGSTSRPHRSITRRPAASRMTTACSV